MSGSRTSIDDIVLLCVNLDAILVYLEFVCKVFPKYRVIFRLDKCDFLKNQFEYVGHGITKAGTTPLNQNSILQMTVSYPLQINLYYPSLR